MPESTKKRTYVETKLNEIKDEIELVVSSKKMTSDMTVSMVTFLVKVMHDYIDEHSIPVKGEISAGLETTFANMSVNANNSSGSMQHSNGGVVLNRDKNGISLKNKRAHLFVICCTCDNCIVIEYASKHIPEFDSSFVFLPKDGAVYTTCKPCAKERKNASKGMKAFDYMMKNMFGDGSMRADLIMYWFVKKHMVVSASIDVKMIMHKGRETYLTKDLIEKKLTGEDAIVCLKKHVNERGYETARLDWYDPGSFLTI